ncbi:iron ABC transporter permease [Gluconacetobacter tumulisoli]|uniref:Iron ABC transporter permease n=2 Tax=Gluconacetobacter tumulisoli TaxID=1286189 RepID=A0A7W4K689_9PROT|nr:iron ABC transporter permease [Gluconacetobacter tumulisoli]MBB2201147.1 iron ABC transporter permease [Gluconacetobacter tumulisoli]
MNDHVTMTGARATAGRDAGARVLLAAERVGHVRDAYRRLLRRRVSILAVLGILILGSVVLDFALGPSGMSPATLLRILLHPHDGPAGQSVIVWQIRLPYALMAVCVGAALGLSGAEMQTILNNPLASPFTLGVSAAAAFGASLAIVLQWQIPGVPAEWVVSADAFAFAIASAFLLDLVSRLRDASTSTVVLFGIALVFTFHALVSLVQFVASEDALQDLVFWTMGSLTRANWSKLGILATACAVILPLSFRASWSLTALRMGEERAASFGIDVRRVRIMALLRISVLSALAVSFVGTIGFVGLVAPHIARRLLGEDHRFYLPGSVLVGCLIMSLSAVAARTVLPGVIVPVGIVTALVGIPFFLAIVLRRQVAS